jgi:adenylate cyclase
LIYAVTAEQDLPHKLAAILYADVEGYSRLTGADETGTHRTLSAYLDLFAETIKAHRGEVKHYAGDAVLADFTTVSDALNCAVEFQKASKEKNETVQDDKRVKFRIGLNLGEVIVDRGEVYGNGVNVAARLETLAEPGGICISGAARDAIGNKLALSYEYLGEHQVKNIEEPVRAYRVNFTGEPSIIPETSRPPSRKLAIRWPAMAVALLAALAVGAWWIFSRPAASLAAASTARASVPVATNTSQPAKANRIAVLPFANLSADKDNEYFSDGMTEEMISKLSRVPGLEVIARTSVIVYKGTNKKISEIAKELNVSSVLEGSVRRNGDKLRITAQLINAANEAHLWSNDYDRDLRDVFAIQSDVARSVAEALRVTLSSTITQQIDKKGTDNLEAYDLYLQGMYHQNKMTPEGLEKSLEYFNRAIALDSSFARPHAAAGFTYDLFGGWGIKDPRDTVPKAKALARRALELDDTLVEAHGVIADMAVFDLDWPLAEASSKHALSLNPNSAFALDGYAVLYLSPWGRHDEAIAAIRRAIELDPSSLLYRTDFVFILMEAQRNEEAIEEAKRALKREPAPNVWWSLGVAYSGSGAHDLAIAAFQKNMELSGQNFVSLGGLGYAYARAGKRDEALKVLATMKERAKKETVDPAGFAYVYVGLDDNDAAMEWLQRTYDERPNIGLAFLKEGPFYNRIRSDPRFIALLKKIGFKK